MAIYFNFSIFNLYKFTSSNKQQLNNFISINTMSELHRKSFFNTSTRIRRKKQYLLIHRAHTQSCKSENIFQQSRITSSSRLQPILFQSVVSQKIKGQIKHQTKLISGKTDSLYKQDKFNCPSIQEQLFKQDKRNVQLIYQHKRHKTEVKSQRTNLSPSIKRINQQNKLYHDKSAILNEIVYSKQIHQQYGDKYFEYYVRDRFKDTLNFNSFVYQIKDKFSESPFILKLKRIKPNLLPRHHLVLKAKSISTTFKD